MKKTCAFSLLVFLIAVFPNALLAGQAGQGDAAAFHDGWVEMPAGAKPAYLGIHGGTMPVSLLVAGDGAALLTFVGRTGNDFLEVLREAALPGFGNATKSGALALERAHAGLFAGNATATLPVISIAGDILARQAWFESLEPFGFSERPLSIEGAVTAPAAASTARRYRNFFLPGPLRLRGTQQKQRAIGPE